MSERDRVLLAFYEVVKGDVNRACPLHELFAALQLRYTPFLDENLHSILSYWISEKAILHTGFERTGEIDVTFGTLFLMPRGVEKALELKGRLKMPDTNLENRINDLKKCKVELDALLGQQVPLSRNSLEELFKDIDAAVDGVLESVQNSTASK